MLLDQGLVRNQEAWGLAFKLRPGRSFFSAFPLPAGTWRLKAFPAGQPEGQAQGPRARASPGAPHPSQQGRSERLWLGPARIISCLQAAQWPQASPPAGPAATGLCAVPISQPSPRSWPPLPLPARPWRRVRAGLREGRGLVLVSGREPSTVLWKLHMDVGLGSHPRQSPARVTNPRVQPLSLVGVEHPPSGDSLLPQTLHAVANPETP